MSSRLRTLFLCLLLALAFGAHASQTPPAETNNTLATYAFGPETWTASALPADPKLVASCRATVGASGGYLGCEVTIGSDTTHYPNCTNNRPPCMDKPDCDACTNIPGDD